MKAWTKMPSTWIRYDEGLTWLRWNDQGANQIAALMLYIVFVQHANDTPTPEFQKLGFLRLTYTRLSTITGLSRAKISGGIQVLMELGVVEKSKVGHSNQYWIAKFGQNSGWGKLPVRGLYTTDLARIKAFHLFKLRSRAELDALKLYLLVVAFRSNTENFATISYGKISQYTGILRTHISAAISHLVNCELIRVQQKPSEVNEYSTVNTYRLTHLEPYKHPGTRGRALIESYELGE